MDLPPFNICLSLGSRALPTAAVSSTIRLSAIITTHLPKPCTRSIQGVRVTSRSCVSTRLFPLGHLAASQRIATETASFHFPSSLHLSPAAGSGSGSDSSAAAAAATPQPPSKRDKDKDKDQALAAARAQDVGTEADTGVGKREAVAGTPAGTIDVTIEGEAGQVTAEEMRQRRIVEHIKAGSTPSIAHRSADDWTLRHPLWKDEYVGRVAFTHLPPKGIVETLAFYTVKLMRFNFDCQWRHELPHPRGRR